MRLILFLLILVVLALIAAIGSGYLSISQTQPAKVPQVSTRDGVSASGGQAPSFDVQTGSVKVEKRNVNVPTLQVEPASRDSSAATTQNAK